MVALILTGLPLGTAQATGWRKVDNELAILNHKLAGKVVDYTFNHGVDNRIYSRSLHQRRDLYVYLPPQYDPNQRYPIILWFHGFASDEQEFTQVVVAKIDQAIRTGCLPPVIVAAPDGSLPGEPCYFRPGSFFINSLAGDFEDYILQDVWNFVVSHYPIRPERGAHVLAGASMGGFGAFNLGIRYRQSFGTAVGMFPPLNLRWTDDKDNYRANFDPEHWGWKTEMDNGWEVIARFGFITLRVKDLLYPLFGKGEQALVAVSAANPIELIDRTHLQNGELNMYVGYAGKDEFNIDAQVESFLYYCKCRGIAVAVGYEPDGKHDAQTAYRLMPAIFHWLAPILAPYSPPLAAPVPVPEVPAHVPGAPPPSRTGISRERIDNPGVLESGQSGETAEPRRGWWPWSI